MAKPSHFKSEYHFSAFILECAISDRVTYRDAFPECEENKEIIKETNKEIKAMKLRLNKVFAQMKRRNKQ